MLKALYNILIYTLFSQLLCIRQVDSICDLSTDCTSSDEDLAVEIEKTPISYSPRFESLLHTYIHIYIHKLYCVVLVFNL